MAVQKENFRCQFLLFTNLESHASQQDQGQTLWSTVLSNKAPTVITGTKTGGHSQPPLRTPLSLSSHSLVPSHTCSLESSLSPSPTFPQNEHLGPSLHTCFPGWWLIPDPCLSMPAYPCPLTHIATTAQLVSSHVLKSTRLVVFLLNNL